MSTLIAFASKHGSAGTCADLLAKQLTGQVEVCNLKTAKNVDLARYDRVIIGGSIYVGNIQKEVKRFCTENLTALQSKKLGMFICCMEEGEKAEKQLSMAFPQELLAKAAARGIFGGEFRFQRMNFLERFMIKQVAKVEKKPVPDMTKDTSTISEAEINRFAALMNQS